MKNKNRLLNCSPLLLLIFLSAQSFAQTYCTPPRFETGPYTGIQSIKLNNLDHQSTFSDGYADFTQDAQLLQLKPGETYNVDLVFYYDPALVSTFTGYLNFRIWADLNQDWDFTDANETLYSGRIDCRGVRPNAATVKASISITVPNDAQIGSSRMRIYNDMLVADGHITPNPCGYEGMSGSLGQHGECEDYALEVSESANIISISESAPQPFPNPSNGLVFFNESVKALKVFNTQGKLMTALAEESDQVDLSEFATGMYIISYLTSENVRVNTRISKL